MFDIAWSELMVIAVVALVVIGPKDLPKAIFTLGKWVRKARVVARDFQGHIDDMMREAELDELRQQALKVRDTNLKSMVENTVDPKGELKNAFDVSMASGTSGHPGSTPEEDGAAPANAPVGSPQVAAAQPLPATEPPVTAPLPEAPPVEFTPTPAAAPAAAPAPAAPASVAEPVPAPTTNKQA